MWPLIRKDLMRRWRSPASTLVMVAFPLFMSLAIGMVFGTGGNGQEFPRIRVLVENRDEGGFLADALVGALGQEQGQEYLEVEIVGEEGEALMEDGKASALVIIPEGFSTAIVERRPTALSIVRNPSEGIKPEIIVQGGELVAAYLDQGSRLLGGELGNLQEMIKADEMPASAKVGALAARVMDRIRDVESYLFPPLVGIGSAKEQDPDAGEDDPSGGGVFGYILVMTTVMALLFVATRSVGDLFEEKNSGMLRRQAATPLPVVQIITAKFLFSVVLGLLVMLILAGTGLVLGWITAPADPAAALLLGLAFNLAACGLVAVFIGLVRNEKQAGILSWLIVMGMSALGGSLTPVDQMPAAMQGLARFTLNHWAIDGFNRLMFDDANLQAVAGNILVLLVAGGVLTLAANLLLVRRFREMTS
ncbi:MAG: ABC transporter permease [bacterium]